MSAPHAAEEGLIAANSALIPPEMAWIPTAILLLAYVFIAWERIPKVVIALIGASILLVTQLVTQAEALAFVDFNVIA
jgi:Na+/H+ antiporter NhaD/arsenite permease-like protein